MWHVIYSSDKMCVYKCDNIRIDLGGGGVRGSILIYRSISSTLPLLTLILVLNCQFYPRWYFMSKIWLCLRPYSGCTSNTEHTTDPVRPYFGSTTNAGYTTDFPRPYSGCTSNTARTKLQILPALTPAVLLIQDKLQTFSVLTPEILVIQDKLPIFSVLTPGLFEVEDKLQNILLRVYLHCWIKHRFSSSILWIYLCSKIKFHKSTLCALPDIDLTSCCFR